MTPQSRAAADRLILDTANVKYIVEYLPRGAAHRVVEGTGWTVGQTIGHVALDMTDLARAIENLTAEGDEATIAIDFTARAAAHARMAAKWGPRELVRRLDGGLVALTEALATFEPAKAGATIGGQPIEDILDSTHAAAHGLDLSETIEEMRFDPLVLNWLLYADFSGKPELFDRQRKLFEDARAYFQELGEGEDTEDSEED